MDKCSFWEDHQFTRVRARGPVYNKLVISVNIINFKLSQWGVFVFKYLLATITVTILCGSTALAAYNDEYKYFIGRKFWVIDASSVTFYENCTYNALAY